MPAGPEDQAKRQEQIKDVITKIESDAGAPLEKKPNVGTIEKVLGWNISKQERDDAWKSLKAGTGTEQAGADDDDPTPKPGANKRQKSLEEEKANWPKVQNLMANPLNFDGEIIPPNGIGVVRDFAKLKKENRMIQMWLENGYIKEVS